MSSLLGDKEKLEATGDTMYNIVIICAYIIAEDMVKTIDRIFFFPRPFILHTIR